MPYSGRAFTNYSGDPGLKRRSCFGGEQGRSQQACDARRDGKHMMTVSAAATALPASARQQGLAPDLGGGLDDQAELGGLLLAGQRIALHG